VIPINKPLVDEDEIQAVVNVLRSGNLTSRTESGSMVDKLEDGFAEFTESKYAVAVNSGTSALYLSLLASQITQGDEVIVPSFTFVATAESVVLAGGTPVFADIDPDTFNIDPEEVSRLVTKKTKAVIPVDLFGLPVDMKHIREIADKHSLTIIEDAAQAHGARYDGKHVGAFADLACWSFYASKNMTTGEGGMITTNLDEYAAKLPYMRSHGEKGEYVSSMIGGNFRLPEIEAAIGYVQLKKLPEFLKRREENATILHSKLQNIDALRLPTVQDGCKHSWYLFTVKLENGIEHSRKTIVQKLRKAGIGASVYYKVPIHQMPFYRKFCGRSLPHTEETAQIVFSLPVHPAVTPEQAEYIAETLRQILA
jgi:perosamine synthetase